MRKLVLLICVVVFSACAVQRDALTVKKINDIEARNAQLEKRVKKLEHGNLIQNITNRMQSRLDDELIKNIKHFFIQVDKFRYEFFRLEAGHTQLDKDISVLWEKVLRFHRLSKSKKHQRENSDEQLFEVKVK